MAETGILRVINGSRVPIKFLLTEYFDAAGNSYAISANMWNLVAGQTVHPGVGNSLIKAQRLRYKIVTDDGFTNWSCRVVRDGYLTVELNNWMHREWRQLWVGRVLADRGQSNPREIKFTYDKDRHLWTMLADDPVHRVTRLEDCKEVRYETQFVELVNLVNGKIYRIYNEFALFESEPNGDWTLLTYMGGWRRTSDYTAIVDSSTSYSVNGEYPWQGIVWDESGRPIGAVTEEPVTSTEVGDQSARETLNDFLEAQRRQQEEREFNEYVDRLNRENLEKQEREKREREHREYEKKVQEYREAVKRISNEGDRRQTIRRDASDFVKSNGKKFEMKGSDTYCNYFARELGDALNGGRIPELWAGKATDVYDSLLQASTNSAQTGWHDVNRFLRQASPTFTELERRFNDSAPNRPNADAERYRYYWERMWESRFLAASNASERGRIVVAVTRGHIAIITPAPITSPTLVPPNARWPMHRPYVTQAGKTVFSGQAISHGFTPKDLLTLEIFIYDKQHFKDLLLAPGALKPPQ